MPYLPSFTRRAHSFTIGYDRAFPLNTLTSFSWIWSVISSSRVQIFMYARCSYLFDRGSEEIKKKDKYQIGQIGSRISKKL